MNFWNKTIPSTVFTMQGSRRILFVTLMLVLIASVKLEKELCGDIYNKQYCNKTQFCNYELKIPTCENCWDYRKSCFTTFAKLNCTTYCKGKLTDEINGTIARIYSEKLQNAEIESEKLKEELAQQFSKSDMYISIISVLSVFVIILLGTLIYLHGQSLVKKLLQCAGNKTKELEKDPGVQEGLLNTVKIENQNIASNTTSNQTNLQNYEIVDDINNEPLPDGTQDNEPARSSSDTDILGQAVNAVDQTMENIAKTGTQDNEPPKSSSDIDILDQALNGSEEARINDAGNGSENTVNEEFPIQNSEPHY